MDSIFILAFKELFPISVVRKDKKYGIPGTGIAFHLSTAENQPLISGATMATKTLKDMKNDFDEDTLENHADSSLDNKKQSRIKTLIASMSVKAREIFKKLFGSKKMVMITVAGMILLTSIVTAGIFFFGKSSEMDKDNQDKAVAKEAATAAGTVMEKVVFEDIVVLKPFDRIRLKEGSSMKFISLDMSLELSDARYKKEVTAMEDKIRQIITRQAEGMTWLELRNPEGKIMLKYDLLKRMNSIFPEVMIRNIYFTNFLMQ